MDKTVLQQIDELHRMPLAGLRKRWADLMGGDGSRFSRAYLVRRLAYRVQELAYGGLSHEARRQLKQIAAGKPVNANAKRKRPDMAAGTRLIREWHGDRYEVIVQADGFLYDGKPYRSLTAIAKAITGSNWNGNLFFGIAGRRERSKAKP